MNKGQLETVARDLQVTVTKTQQENAKLRDVVQKILEIVNVLAVKLQPKAGSKGFAIALWRVAINLPLIVSSIKQIINIVLGKEINLIVTK